MVKHYRNCLALLPIRRRDGSSRQYLICWLSSTENLNICKVEFHENGMQIIGQVQEI